MHMRNTARTTRHWLVGLGSSIVLLLAIAYAGYHYALQTIKSGVQQALGPNGEVRELRVTLTGLEISGIRIKAPQDTAHPGAWPTEDELRAERVLIRPSLADLIGARVVLSEIRVEGAYISLLRAMDGHMRVLPSLLEPALAGKAKETAGKAPGDDKAAMPPITIAHIELVDGTIEFFDATIKQPPLRQRLEKISATLENLKLPELTGQSAIKLSGVHKGIRHDGQLAISGSLELASKDSGLTTTLQGVDLLALQPYLVKAADTGIKKGTLDFELNSSVKKGVLHAPGSLTLSDLELSSSGTSVMGMPRQAMVNLMKNRKGKISINFTLDGNINDPHFSLNENLLTQVGASFTNVLGVSVESLVKGVEGIGSGVVQSLGKTLGVHKK